MWLTIAPTAGLASMGLALYLFFYVSRQESGTPRMRQISAAISEGARAYMKRQYQTLAIFTLVVAAILAVVPQLGLPTAMAYILGSVSSGLAGFIGMEVALKANVRTAHAARKGLTQAFPLAFYAGAVMGLSVVGLALLGISTLYFIYGDPDPILGFSFGVSTLALLAKAGGGIYTKTADISADLVGKVEIGIPEDDPRNPAVIADNVGDNVGDVAGMGADLYDSYVAAVVAAMVVGAATLGPTGAILPPIIAAIGIFASMAGVGVIRLGKKDNPGAALNRGTYITCAIFTLLAFVVMSHMGVDMNLFYAALAGLIVGVVIGITTDYFTSIDMAPARKTAEMSKTGPSLNILTGFSYGSISVVPPLIGIGMATLISYHLAGIYGVTISAVGIMATVGMIVSADAYGPIVDNAKGISEQSGLGAEIIAVTDRLDAAGNTAKAITKGFAIAAAGLTVIALLAAYAEIVGIESVDFMDAFVMTGALIGTSLPPLLAALLILGVGKNSFKMIDEVRRQFREIPGLREGKARPDYAACVDIATVGALRELFLPSILTIVVPLVVGFVLGKGALGGFLAGSILSGMIFAFLMANAGGLWDNAKKFIEAGAFGGKGSQPHKAAVVGDTVGDPFKDTAGPSINTLLCVMSLTASVFAPLIVRYALLGG